MCIDDTRKSVSSMQEVQPGMSGGLITRIVGYPSIAKLKTWYIVLEWKQPVFLIISSTHKHGRGCYDKGRSSVRQLMDIGGRNDLNRGNFVFKNVDPVPKIDMSSRHITPR